MDDFKDSTSALIADVDCTAEGKELCSEHGVRGYPSIKYGDPNDLQEYNGGRTYEDLKQFADENLGPSCSPSNLDLCSDEKKAQIEQFMKMPTSELEASIKEKTDTLEKVETDFKAFLDGLNKDYEAASKKKDDDIAAIKAKGLGILKAVQAHKKKEL